MATVNRDQLGQRIKAWRQAKGLSLREAADRAGINHQSWHNAENGKRLRPDTLRRIVALTGYTMNEQVVLAGSQPDLAAAVDGVPPNRQAVALRVLRLLPRLTEVQVDGLLGILDLWELRLDKPENPQQ